MKLVTKTTLQLIKNTYKKEIEIKRSELIIQVGKKVIKIKIFQTKINKSHVEIKHCNL